MQLFSTVSLLLLASSSFTVQALKDQQQHSSLRREQDQFRRRGKKGGSNGGNASPGNVQGDSGAPARTRDGSAAQIDEPGPAGTCISFNDEIIAASAASQSDLHDAICNDEDNTCGSADSPGCCRYHTNLLVCDTSNDFRQQAVRNEIHLAPLLCRTSRRTTICVPFLSYTHTIVRIPCPPFSASVTITHPYPLLLSRLKLHLQLLRLLKNQEWNLLRAATTSLL